MAVAFAAVTLTAALSAWVILHAPGVALATSTAATASTQQAQPQFDYFPSRYVNQGKEIEPAPPTF